MTQHSLSRTELLLGKETLDKLKNSKVVIFGIGGVGSFTVEALARAGVGKIVIVDDDDVCVTNINRQIHATFKTIGKAKVDVMKERITDINPNCQVVTHKTFVTKENICDIVLEDTDYVVDAIDTVTSKIALVLYCKEKNIEIISCLGTGNKLDPTKFKIADIYSTKICPLAKVMRYELRKREVESLKVLYSEEEPIKPKIDDGINLEDNDKSLVKRQIPGSISFVPSVAGLIIAGEVIKDLIK